MPIDVIDILKQKNSAIFPLVEDSDFLGGLRVVSDLAALSAIPSSYRKPGMIAVLRDTGDMYWLKSLPDTWEKVEFGSPPIDLLEANCLFVSVDGGTGERGNRSRPYASVFDAMKDSMDGDVVLVGPGEFIESDPSYEMESKGISLVGAGVGRTLISFGEHVCHLDPGQIVRWANFSFSAEEGVYFGGTSGAAGGTVAWDGVEDTSMEAGVTFQYLEAVNLSGCLVGEYSGLYKARNVSEIVRLLGCEFWSEGGVEIDGSSAILNDCVFFGCLTGLKSSGVSRIRVASDCRFLECQDAVWMGSWSDFSLGGRVEGKITATGQMNAVIDGAYADSLVITGSSGGSVTVLDSVFDGGISVDEGEGLTLSLSLVKAESLSVTDAESMTVDAAYCTMTDLVVEMGSDLSATLRHSDVGTANVGGASSISLSILDARVGTLVLSSLSGEASIKHTRVELATLTGLDGMSVDTFGLDVSDLSIEPGFGLPSSLALRGSRVGVLSYHALSSDCGTTIEDSHIEACIPSGSSINWVRSTLGREHHEGWCARPVKWEKGLNPGHIQVITPGAYFAEGTPIRIEISGIKVWPLTNVGVSGMNLTGVANAMSDPSGRLTFVEMVGTPPLANQLSIYLGDVLVGMLTYASTGTYTVSPRNGSGLGGTVTISDFLTGSPGTVRQSIWEFFQWGIVAGYAVESMDLLWHGPSVPAGAAGRAIWIGDPGRVAIERISEEYNRAYVTDQGLWPTSVRGALTWEYPPARPVKQVFITAEDWTGMTSTAWTIRSRVDGAIDPDANPGDLLSESIVQAGRKESGHDDGFNLRLCTGDSINVKSSEENEPAPEFMTAYLICVLE